MEYRIVGRTQRRTMCSQTVRHSRVLVRSDGFQVLVFLYQFKTGPLTELINILWLSYEPCLLLLMVLVVVKESLHRLVRQYELVIHRRFKDILESCIQLLFLRELKWFVLT